VEECRNLCPDFCGKSSGGSGFISVLIAPLTCGAPNDSIQPRRVFTFEGPVSTPTRETVRQWHSKESIAMALGVSAVATPPFGSVATGRSEATRRVGCRGCFPAPTNTPLRSSRAPARVSRRWSSSGRRSTLAVPATQRYYHTHGAPPTFTPVYPHLRGYCDSEIACRLDSGERDGGDGQKDGGEWDKAELMSKIKSYGIAGTLSYVITGPTTRHTSV
jgi:hypothetical protein